MTRTELENLSIACDLKAVGTRDELAALDLKLLEAGKRYYAFFVPMVES